MKRFLAFRYRGYYPSGGWNDFVGDFDSIEEGKSVFPVDAHHLGNIVDCETKTIVAKLRQMPGMPGQTVCKWTNGE